MSQPLPSPIPPQSSPFPIVWRVAIIGVALFIFAIACLLPAARMENGTDWVGGEMLLLGPLGFFFLQFAWFANLLFIPTLICIGLGWWRAALILTIMQTLFALNMLTFPGAEIMLDEGGVNKTHVLKLLPGAWVWLISMFLPACSYFVVLGHKGSSSAI